jgi:hypothetical protein
MQSEPAMRSNANTAVRALTNRIYRNFRKRFGKDWDLPVQDIAWMNTDDPSYALGAIGIHRPEHPEADWAMEMARTIAANAVFRCHHGLIAVMADHQPPLFALAVGEGRIGGDDKDAFRELLLMAQQAMCCFGAPELAAMRERVDIDSVRYLARASFAKDAGRRLERVLNPKPDYWEHLAPEAELERSGGGNAHWLFLNMVLCSLTGNTELRQLIGQSHSHPEVQAAVSRHDEFLLALRSADGLTQQHLWGQIIRNSDQAALLLLFGIREVDWIIPSFEPVAVSPAVHTQLRAAWSAMSALLHIDIPDYQATLANIIKAVEEELLQTYFEPFFSGGAVPDEPYNRERFGRLYDFGKRWPRQKPSLGEMTHFLKMAEQPEVSASSLTQFPSYVQSWIRFLWIERAATARPSLGQSLEEFSKLRNSNTHGGHSPTERDVALIGRARAWTIITHVARERTDDTLVSQRRSMRARELGL